MQIINNCLVALLVNLLSQCPIIFSTTFCSEFGRAQIFSIPNLLFKLRVLIYEIIQYCMNKNFRSTLKIWLNKVCNLNKKPKKVVNDIAKKLTFLEIKESKNQIEDRIVDNLFAKFEQLKTQLQSPLQGIQLIKDFLTENHLQASEKLKDNMDLSIERYFSNTNDGRACQDFITNIWHQQAQMYDCVCPRATKDLQFVEQKENCYRCGRDYHINCLWTKQSKEELYQCPMCFLTNCIPNKKIVKILFAGYLRQTKKDKIQYKINLPLQNGVSGDHIIQARSVRLSKDSRYEIVWPANCSVILNSKKIMDFKPLNFNSCLKKRMDDEIQFDKRLLSRQNSLVIEEKHQYLQGFRNASSENHLIVVAMVKPLKVNQMIQEMMKFPMEIQDSKEILRDYLNRGIQDCFIDRLKVSLKCQFFNGRITLPARSKHCMSHYQPFDIKGFILANINIKSSSQRWKCPICKKRAYHLLVDKYLLKFINSSPNLSQIDFNSQGEPHIVESFDSEGEQQKSIVNQKLDSNQDIIDDQQEIESSIGSKGVKKMELEKVQELSYQNNDRGEEERGLKGKETEKEKQINSQKQRQFIEYIELDSDPEIIQIKNVNAKRSSKQEKPINADDQQQSVDIEQSLDMNRNKRLHNIQTNPFSYMHQKVNSLQCKLIEQQNDLYSESININSKHSDYEEELFNLKRSTKKEKKERKRKEKERQWQFKKCNKMAKTLVPSPSISTVIPEAIRILEKRFPQMPKKPTPCVPTIDIIQSEEQDPQQRLASKIRYQREQLLKQRHFLIQRGQKCQITTSDEAIFYSVCQKFMLSSAKV